jgi:hypothetical protein
MHIVRGILLLAILVGAFFIGGPFIGVMAFSSTVMLPVLFVATIVVLAVWKIRELTRR